METVEIEKAFDELQAKHIEALKNWKRAVNDALIATNNAVEILRQLKEDNERDGWSQK